MKNNKTIIDIGFIGLGSMGYNLALNLISKGFIIHGYDPNFNKKKVDNLLIYSSIKNLCSSIKSLPKIIMLSLPSTEIDRTILELIKRMKKNDIVVDLGNSFYLDSIKRYNLLKKSNLNFLAVGVSGGPLGAKNGPSIMAGGSNKAWKKIKNVFETMAAKDKTQTSCVYFGGPGNGHFIKMIHNGIEYAFMQALAEISLILQKTFCLNYFQQKQIFQSLLKTDVSCYLIQVTSEIICAKSNNRIFIDIIDNQIGQNGTGNWTIKTALDLGVSVPTIYSALSTRMLSKNFQKNSKIINEIKKQKNIRINQRTITDIIMFVFSCAMYQGISVIDAFNKNHTLNIDIDDVFKAWFNGSILQGRFLRVFFKNFNKHKICEKESLYKFINSQIISNLDDARKLIGISNSLSIPIPVISSSFNYYDTLFTNHKIGEITQLQRSFFGQHPLKSKNNLILEPFWTKNE